MASRNPEGLWAARPRLEEWFLGMTCTCEFEWRWTPQDQKTKYPDMCLRCGKVRRNGIVINVGKCWDEEKPEPLGPVEAEIRLMAEPLRVHRCDQCGQSFDDLAALARHAEIPHTWREAHVPSARHNVVIENLMGGYHRSIADMDKPTSLPPLLQRRRY